MTGSDTRNIYFSSRIEHIRQENNRSDLKFIRRQLKKPEDCKDFTDDSLSKRLKFLRDHLFCTFTNFPKNYYFLPLNTYIYVCLSGV